MNLLTLQAAGLAICFISAWEFPASSYSYGDREIKMKKEKFGKASIATATRDIKVIDYSPSTPRDENLHFCYASKDY